MSPAPEVLKLWRLEEMRRSCETATHANAAGQFLCVHFTHLCGHTTAPEALPPETLSNKIRCSTSTGTIPQCTSLRCFEIEFKP